MLRNADGTRSLRYGSGMADLCAGEQCSLGEQPLLHIACKTPRGFQVDGALLQGQVSDKRVHKELRSQGFAMTKSQRRRLRGHITSCEASE